MLLVIININAHAQASAESLPAELSRVDFPRKFQENPKTLRSDSIIITLHYITLHLPLSVLRAYLFRDYSGAKVKINSGKPLLLTN